jgi:ParB-like nuclease domain
MLTRPEGATVQDGPPLTAQIPFNWRAHPPVHPAAELFPLMSESELKELAEDIKANGLIDPTVVWADDNGDNFLLDGRNRLDAMALAGILGVDDYGILFDVKTGFPVCLVELLSQKPCVKSGDPYALALSLNVHRRHLTNEDKDRLIAELIKANPEKSNRQSKKRCWYARSPSRIRMLRRRRRNRPRPISTIRSSSND